MKIRSTFFGVTLVFGMVATPAGANTYLVTRFDDPSGAPCTATNCSLRGAILAANAHSGTDVVRLGRGEYVLSLVPFLRSSPGGALAVTDRLSITGVGTENTRIRQTTTYRVFTVQHTSLAMSGLVVSGGRAHSTTFPGNAGGCMYSDNGVVTLTNVVVGNCDASGSGGAIYMSGGTTTLHGSVVELNGAQFGAAVAMKDAGPHLALLEGSRMTRNTAGYYGGAVFASATTGFDGVGADIQMSADSSIAENSAPFGGALYNDFAKHLVARLSAVDMAVPGALARIAHNTAGSGYGGAIYSEGGLAIVRLSLENNDAGRGGAVYVQREPQGACPTTSIQDSRLANNVATIDGGAVWAEQGGLFIDSASFDGNVAGGSGGALLYRSGDYLQTYPCEPSMVNLTNLSFTNNVAAKGGGIEIADEGNDYGYADVSIDYSTFLGNQSSGFPLASDVYVDNHTVHTAIGDMLTDNRVRGGSSIYTGSCFYFLAYEMTSTGGNFDTSGSCVPTLLPSDHAGVSVASLGLSYGDFGGPFPLAAIVSANSPAINAGTTPCPSTDARGAPRVAGSCDSGAFEYGAVVP